VVLHRACDLIRFVFENCAADYQLQTCSQAALEEGGEEWQKFSNVLAVA
jgi:hypothetical protein